MGYSLAFLITQLADLITFLLLPHGHELNPMAFYYPVESASMKAMLIVFVLLARFGRYRTAVLLFGTFMGLLGFLSNIQVILAF